MPVFFLIIFLHTGQVVWSITPDHVKNQAISIAIDCVLQSEAIQGLFAVWIIANEVPMPIFGDTDYAIDKVRGLTAEEAINRFGEPLYDTRDDVDETDFSLTYHEPGSFFGRYAILVFEEGVVVDSYPQDK